MANWQQLTCVLICLWASSIHAATAESNSEPDANEATARRQAIVLVVGAGGSEEFDTRFNEWADRWQGAADAATAQLIRIGSDASTDVQANDRDQLKTALEGQANSKLDLLWLVLIGHGTFDGQAAKFNLRGPDVTAEELAEWLNPVESPTVVINCASSSGPFLKQLAADNRIVVTATRSGFELNFARFGGYLSGAINDPAADLDKDEQVSLLEAYLTACRRVEEFYDQETRLATEHALLDDNGDGLGTPADWFRGLRATKRAKKDAALDGLRAHQTHLVVSDRESRIPIELRTKRDSLEQQVEQLRDKKSQLDTDDYYQQLELLMIELARVYQSTERDAPR